jgi:hypothetical protein
MIHTLIVFLCVQLDRQLGTADAASALAGLPQVAAVEIDAPWWTGPAGDGKPGDKLLSQSESAHMDTMVHPVWNSAACNSGVSLSDESSFALLLLYRFAYETGAKCLYPNLPGQRALVVNHREPGENYAASLGPDGSLVTAAETGVMVDAEGDINHARPAGNAAVSSPAELLSLSLQHLPDMSTLATMQYDYNLRRAGALGADAAYVEGDGSKGGHFVAAVQLYNEHRRLADVRRASLEHSVLPATLKPQHWVHIQDMIERTLLRGAHVLHLTYSPLLLTLPTPHNHFTQTFHDLVMGSSGDFRDPQWWAAAGRKDVPAIAYALHATTVGTSAEEMSKRAVQLIVVDMTAHTVNTDAYATRLSAFTALLQPIEYLLTIGACTSAPTDIVVNFVTQFDGSARQRYLMVEDVCSLGDADVGAVLYR